MKTALIGLGLVAEQIHLPACRLVEGLDVVAGCDPRPERRAQMTSRFSIPVTYENSRTMLDAVQPDLVIVATPPETHFEMCLLALEHGAHVLCEKPFMSSVEQADTAIAAAQSANRLLRVNTQYRYMRIYRETRRRLTGGEFGSLYYAHCWQQMYHPPTDNPTGWRAALQQSTLYEFGAHPLDLLTSFFDALPEAVSAVIPNRPPHSSDVLVHLTLYFPDERLATVVLNRITHAPERYLEMRLDCTEASLRLSYGGLARASLQMQRAQGRSHPDLRLSYVHGGEARVERGGRSQVIASERPSASASATAEVLREMQRSIEAYADGQMAVDLEPARYARELLRLTFAAYEAAQRRAVIDLRENSVK